MHSNYNRTGLQAEKDQNFGSDYFFVFYSIDKEGLGLKKNKNSVIIRTKRLQRKNYFLICSKQSG